MNQQDQRQQGGQTYLARGGAPTRKEASTKDDFDFAAMRAGLGQKQRDAAVAQGAVKVARPAEQAIQIVQPHCARAQPSGAPAQQAPAAAPAQPDHGFVDPLSYRKTGADANAVKDDHDFAKMRANLGKKQSEAKRAQSQVYIVGKTTTSLS